MFQMMMMMMTMGKRKKYGGEEIFCLWYDINGKRRFMLALDEGAMYQLLHKQTIAK